MKTSKENQDVICTPQNNNDDQFPERELYIKKIGAIKPVVKMIKIINALCTLFWVNSSLFLLINFHILKGNLITNHIVEINAITSYIFIFSMFFIYLSSSIIPFLFFRIKDIN
ncbi:MAG TPA: hypothetical protein VNG53_08690 [Bacteroidia bacterium]|nr:hypothetical protein [Bacteroidia bacterium]